MNEKDIIIVENLYKRYVRKAIGFAMTYVHDKGLAEDIVQEVFTKLARDIDRNKLMIDEEKVIGLIAKMIKHQYINQLKKDNHTTISLDVSKSLLLTDTCSLEKEYIEKCELRFIKEKLAVHLTELQIDVLMLRTQGYSHNEISAVVGKRETAVRAIYKRARSKAKFLLRGGELHESTEGEY
jgi:RNA polymerase sigma factor (sigma-70 family)